MSGSVDPYKVLDVPKNFTLDQLKEAYKKAAIKVRGNDYMHGLVTDCFKQLLKEYKRRSVTSTDGNNLKSAFMTFLKGNQQVSSQSKQQSGIRNQHPKDHFDIEKFNSLFEENRQQQITDKGYEDWYKNEIIKEAPKFKGGSKEAFNRHFEQHVAHTPVQKAVEEPEAYWSTNLPCMELGAKEVSDFSGDARRLNFTDLKIAHSTSRIIDPNSVPQRQQYNNVDDIKRDRGNIKFNMSPEEEKRYKLRLQEKERQEMMRQKHLMEQDSVAESHFNRVHDIFKNAFR